MVSEIVITIPILRRSATAPIKEPVGRSYSADTAAGYPRFIHALECKPTIVFTRGVNARRVPLLLF